MPPSDTEIEKATKRSKSNRKKIKELEARVSALEAEINSLMSAKKSHDTMLTNMGVALRKVMKHLGIKP